MARPNRRWRASNPLNPRWACHLRSYCTRPSRPLQTPRFEAAFSRIAAFNRILSDYDPDSELSRLSRTAPAEHGVPVSDPLWTVLARSQRLAGRVRRRVRRDRRALRAAMAPRTAREGNALARAPGRGARRGRLSPPEARRERPHRAIAGEPNMRLDLGGIAMGYAVDETLKLLRGAGHHTGAGRCQRRYRRGRSAAGQIGLDDRRGAPFRRRHAQSTDSRWPTRRSPPRATPFNTSTSTASATRTSSIRIPAWD